MSVALTIHLLGGAFGKSSKSRITIKYKYSNDGDKAGVRVVKGVQRKASKFNWDEGGQERFSRKKGLLTLNSKKK